MKSAVILGQNTVNPTMQGSGRGIRFFFVSGVAVHGAIS